MLVTPGMLRECPQCHLVDGDDGHGEGHHQLQWDLESWREKRKRRWDLGLFMEFPSFPFSMDLQPGVLGMIHKSQP